MAERARFEHWESSDGLWRYHLKAGNGEIVATGEGYDSEGNCKRAMHRLGALALQAGEHESKQISEPAPF